jgi:hypothetical protein
MEKKDVLWSVGMAVIFVFTVVLVGGLMWWHERYSFVPSFEEFEPVVGFVSGTEYVPGQDGQVIVEARYANGTSALDVCSMTVWYPDKSVFFVANGTIGANGNEYVNFIVPDIDGVYEYQAICILQGGKIGTASKSFHVSSERIQAVIAR